MRPHTAVLHVVLYMLYTCMLYSRWAAGLMVACHVGQLYTYLRRWQFSTIVWENTNGVHFRAVWKNTAHVQGIRCSPKGSHLIPWTSAVFSNTALKWPPFAYHQYSYRMHTQGVVKALYRIYRKSFSLRNRLVLVNWFKIQWPNPSCKQIWWFGQSGSCLNRHVANQIALDKAV